MTEICFICRDDYADGALVKCSTCTFKLCWPCISRTDFKCPQCSRVFNKTTEHCMTTEQLAIITEACYKNGKSAGGGDGLEEANRVLLKDLDEIKERIRLQRYQHEDAVRQQRYQHEDAIRQQRLQHEHAIRQLQFQHERAIRQMRSVDDDAIQLMKSEHDTTVQRLRFEHDKTEQRLRSKYETTIQELRSKYETTIQELRSIIKGLESKICRLKEVICQLVKPRSGPKSKMCRNYNPLTNSAKDCPDGSKCSFVHNVFDLIEKL